MKDYIVKAIAADGKVRAYAATTKLLVERARMYHNTSPVITAALGRLLTAAAMMGSMLKSEEDKLTLKINGDGPMRGMVAVSNYKSQVKGYAFETDVILPPNDKGKLDVGGAVGRGFLSVTRDIGVGTPFTGVSELVTGEVAEDLTYYFASSEQTPSAVALGVLMNKNNTVKQAGGLIVQLMPGVDEETISRLEERIGKIQSITSMLDSGMMPEDILREVLDGFSPELLETVPAEFKCDCSREKMKKILTGLDPNELEVWTKEDKPTEAVCEFCGTAYVFQPDEIREMIEEHKKEENENRSAE